MTLTIVADENIPYAREAFAPFGTVHLLPGRHLTSDELRGADALLVRSITKVNESLLHCTPVRFVGTATIGTDHVDLEYLQANNIAFAAAPGCNANSVGEYIAAALLVLAGRQGRPLAGRTLGIIGHGNAGRAVETRAHALGMQVVLHDPPRAQATRDQAYRALGEALDCDFISLHVPLTRGGEHPTFHLVDQTFLRAMRPDAFLLNSSRGAVIDNPALLHALKQQQLAGAVLDVWEGEPAINAALAEYVAIATPHIAGYSFDGKVAGTRQIHESFCANFGFDPAWSIDSLLPPPAVPALTLHPAGEATVSSAVRAVYDILADDNALRHTLTLPAQERPLAFDRLRREYPQRREFHHTHITLQPHDPALAEQLRGLGFK
jgi:erythronate-4-phosphate dehydrogenase